MRKIKLEELKELLRNSDEIKFSFRKKSGERRVAIATLKHDSIENSGYVFPESKSENKAKRKPRENVLNFFDLKETEWRSCSTLLNEEFNLYDSVDEELAEEDVTKEFVSEFYNDGETDENLRTDMSMGVVKFHFQKVNGEERIAIGTTNSELLSLIDIKPDEKISDTSCIRFFDLMKKEWRAAKLGTILSVEYKVFNMKNEDFLELCNTIIPNMEK